MKRYFQLLAKLSVKTIYFNFKYLPLRQAVKLPILVSNRVYLLRTSGKLIIDFPAQTGSIRIGYGTVGIFDKKRSRSVWEVSGTVIFQGKCHLGHGSKISVGDSGRLTLGDNFTISAESAIVAQTDVQFGRDCLLSWDILVMDTDVHTIKDQTGKVLTYPKPIIVGNHVWIGCRCLILKGSRIPDGSVIGAGSTVSKPLEQAQTLYVGSPCKAVRENISWED